MEQSLRANDSSTLVPNRERPLVNPHLLLKNLRESFQDGSLENREERERIRFEDKSVDLSRLLLLSIENICVAVDIYIKTGSPWASDKDSARMESNLENYRFR